MIQTMTNLGIQALATALASSFEIKFTHCAIGSGEFDPVETDARSMTALIAPVATVNVSIVRQEESGVAVIADVNNTILPGGTEIREMGVYATVNDGAEFLFSYAYTDEPEIVPPSAESTYERRFISHMLMSDEEAELTVTYDTLYDELTGAAAWRAEVTETLAGKADSADLAPVATSGSASDLTSGTLPADRIASLDVSKLEGVIDSTHLPSYVDDVLEFASISAFPAEGESGKIYVTVDTNKTYRWTGSTYVEISESIALGENESTAYRGDRGAAAYAHAVTNKGAAFASGFYKVTTNAEGHVTAASPVTGNDILSLGILPSGGNAGQALLKASSSDYDFEWGNAGGVAPSAPTNLTITPGVTSNTITWEDPDTASLTSSGLAVWAASVLVRSSTGYPTSINDGTIVVTSGTHNEFVETGYVDDGLNMATTYYYSLFAFSASSTPSVPATASATTGTWADITWADGSWGDISAMLQAHYNGDLDIHDYWHVGDVRSVPLAAMAATGVGESHVAQTVQIALMEADHSYMLASDGTTQTAFIYGIVDFLSNGTSGEYGYMNSSNDNSSGWDGCARRTWCNNVFRAALPSEFQAISKQVNVKTANKGSGANATKVSADYNFFPAEPEIFGANTYSSATYESTSILPQWEYYKTAANRIKHASASGSASYWWERSPYSSYATNFCIVYSGGTAGDNSASYSFGLAPCGCI